MKKHSLSKNTISENLPAISPVTRAMVHERARALALIAGRGPRLVTQADYEQAKCELTGESDMDRQDAMLDCLPEEKPWNPGSGAAGHQTPESFSTAPCFDNEALKGESDQKRTREGRGIQRGEMPISREPRFRHLDPL